MESPFGNYISQLNEYQQKNQCTVKYEEGSTDGPDHFKTFAMRAVVNGQRYPEGTGKSKKEAKLNAAKNALNGLKNAVDTEPTTSSVQNSISTTADSNFIAQLNHYCQTQKSVLDFKLVESRGPPHNPEFVYKAVIKGKEYPEGQGKSAKEAKQHAAQRACAEINEQSAWTTQSSEDDSSSQSHETTKTEVAVHSPETPFSSSSIVFKNSSAASSSMAISPSVLQSPPDVKPKIKLAPNFNLSPNGLAGSKEVGPNMNVQNPAKPSRGQMSNQVTKSRFLEDFDSMSAVGKGGFGRVFKARRILENTYYAVKVVKSTEKALREVTALAKFDNANIVRYYSCWVEDTAYRPDSSESYSHSDSGSDPGTKFLYIQMEFCEGDTLRAWIDKRNSSSAHDPERRAKAARINRQVLKAVEYIHKEDKIHRDLKPLNIMFSSEGKVKVGDFGLVTAAESENDEQLLERTKRTGTHTYMSPEQFTTEYNRKVDIYALGLIYFELIWTFFTAHEKKKIWEDIRNRNFPPQFSKKFNFEHKLIDRMLSLSPEERPDASELIRDLDRYIDILSADKDNRTI